MVDPLARLNEEGLAFLAERHLGVLSTIGADGRVHSVLVGFTVRDGLLRVIASRRTTKVRNVLRDDRVAVAQVDGRRWVTVQGTGSVLRSADEVRAAEELYARRYRAPRPNADRVVLLVRPVAVLAAPALRRT